MTSFLIIHQMANVKVLHWKRYELWFLDIYNLFDNMADRQLDNVADREQLIVISHDMIVYTTVRLHAVILKLSCLLMNV